MKSSIVHNKSFYSISSYLKNVGNIEEKIEIKSNREMLNQIKKNDVYVLKYQRYFKLSSILKK